MFFGDVGDEILCEDDMVADPQPARALGKGAPRTAAEIAMQGHLDRSHPAPADEPCRDNLGVVEDEQIAAPQQRRQIRNPPVLQPSRGRDHEQPSGVARLARVGRDQPARQLEIEIVEMHLRRLRPTGHQWGVPDTGSIKRLA